LKGKVGDQTTGKEGLRHGEDREKGTKRMRRRPKETENYGNTDEEVSKKSGNEDSVRLREERSYGSDYLVAWTS